MAGSNVPSTGRASGFTMDGEGWSFQKVPGSPDELAMIRGKITDTKNDVPYLYKIDATAPKGQPAEGILTYQMFHNGKPVPDQIVQVSMKDGKQIAEAQRGLKVPADEAIANLNNAVLLAQGHQLAPAAPAPVEAPVVAAPAASVAASKPTVAFVPPVPTTVPVVAAQAADAKFVRLPNDVDPDRRMRVDFSQDGKSISFVRDHKLSELMPNSTQLMEMKADISDKLATGTMTYRETNDYGIFKTADTINTVKISVKDGVQVVEAPPGLGIEKAKLLALFNKGVEEAKKNCPRSKG
jgi:hypothetical protein